MFSGWEEFFGQNICMPELPYVEYDTSRPHVCDSKDDTCPEQHRNPVMCGSIGNISVTSYINHNSTEYAAELQIA